MSRLVLALALVACKRSEEAPPPAPADPDHVFWAWFQSHALTLDANKDPVAIVQQIQTELDKAEPDVFAELGSAGTARRLVLTADGHQDRFAAVQRLYAARPTVAGWTIVQFRQRDLADVPTVEMDDKKLAVADVRYVATKNGAKLDVDVYVPGYTDADKTLGNLAFLALDHTLGEYDVETKLAGITLLPTDKAPAEARPLTALAAEVDALH